MSRETCLGCPIEECHVEVDGLCNRCDDIEDWLADHDKQIVEKTIDKVYDLVTNQMIRCGTPLDFNISTQEKILDLRDKLIEIEE